MWNGTEEHTDVYIHTQRQRVSFIHNVICEGTVIKPVRLGAVRYIDRTERVYILFLPSRPDRTLLLLLLWMLYVVARMLSYFSTCIILLVCVDDNEMKLE